MANKPSKRIFDEMKAAALSTWTAHNGDEVYINEKIKIVNNQNIREHAIGFFRAFDFQNQRIFLSKVSEETKEYIKQNN